MAQFSPSLAEPVGAPPHAQSLLPAKLLGTPDDGRSPALQGQRLGKRWWGGIWGTSAGMRATGLHLQPATFPRALVTKRARLCDNGPKARA